MDKDIIILEVDYRDLNILKQVQKLVFDTAKEFNMANYDMNCLLELKYSLVTSNIQYRLSNDSFMFVAMKRNEVVGVIEIRDIGSCELSYFYVKGEYHNKGIGKELFLRGINRCKENNERLKYMVIYASDYAIPIYLKLGCKIEQYRNENDFIKYNTLTYWFR